MKDFMDAFGVTEFFAFVAPGLILLFSVALWTDPNVARIIGTDASDQQLVVATVLLIVAYALGMMVTTWANSGADKYVHGGYRRASKTKPDNKRGALRQLLNWLFLQLVAAFHGMPLPRTNPSIVEGQLRIAEGLTDYGGLSGLSLFESRWDSLNIYRTIMAQNIGEPGATIFADADAIHRRLLFTLGVALAVWLLALQCLARAIFFDLTPELPDVSFALLLAAGFGGLALSIGLRRVAGYWWERELFLTIGLTQLADASTDGQEQQQQTPSARDRVADAASRLASPLTRRR